MPEPITHKKDGIAFFDLDGPLRKGTLKEWFDFLHAEGILNDIIWKKMQHEWNLFVGGRKTGMQSAADTLKIYANALAGRNVRDIESAAEKFVERPALLKMHKHSEELISLLSKHCVTALITGQPVEVARAIARKYNIDDVTGTRLEVINRKYTGRILVNNSVLQQKRNSLAALSRRYAGFRKKSFAFGDSWDDIGMLREVMFPVALNPSSKLEEYATHRGWLVIKGKDVVSNVRVVLDVFYLTKTRKRTMQQRKQRYKRIDKRVKRSRPKLI